MRWIYALSIFGYKSLIYYAALLGNNKARQWREGRKNWQKKLRNAPLDPNKISCWFHCASLGEFEQGRPVIESFKRTHPDYQVILTFFSPSGYELKKDYGFADYVCYLPLDTKKNAREFIKLIKPKLALFVKYEFWHFYIRELNKQHIPSLFFSCHFRPGQLFFKPIGSWYRKTIHTIDDIYVQTEESATLLRQINYQRVKVTGDTRFDRVIDIAEQKKDIIFAEAFKDKAFTIVAGSTWPEDEKLLATSIRQAKADLKLIIAPHEIHESHIQDIENRFKDAIRYSKAQLEQVRQANVLIIDNIGMLSSLYQYADIAYVGGGFGKGIHNILEAAVYGAPVLFGPNYERFNEAHELIACQGAFTIKNINEAVALLDNFTLKHGALNFSSKQAKEYVYQRAGASQHVLDWITGQLSKN